jgi:post-segregation antitoxin (ccd killing protein)
VKMATGWMVWTRVELAEEQELRLSIQLAKLRSVGEKKKVRWQARETIGGLNEYADVTGLSKRSRQA